MSEAPAPKYDSGAERADVDSVQAGEVVRHLSHELRQPLSTIDSIAFYLRMVLGEESRAVPQLEKLHHLVEQMNWMLSDAVHLLQAAPANPQMLDLHELVTEALAERSDPKSRFRTDFSGDEAIVRVDAGQAGHLVRSVIMVLGQIAEGKEIIARTRVDGDEVHLEFLVPTLDASQDDLDKLFHPFASGLITGAGMSLAGARRIAEANGGRIQVRSESGRGTLLGSAFPLAV